MASQMDSLASLEGARANIRRMLREISRVQGHLVRQIPNSNLLIKLIYLQEDKMIIKALRFLSILSETSNIIGR